MNDSDTINNALIECVKAIGGSKKVGSMLFPDKPVDMAQRLLLACLNDERAEKLSPDQALFILRLAKDVGCHVGIEFLCHSLSYSMPTPIEPKDELAELQRNFIESTKHLSKMAERIERLAGAK